MSQLSTLSKSGSVTKKWFSKLINPLGDLIYKAWKDQGNKIITGIGAAVLFTFNYLEEKCLENEANRQMVSYS